MKEVFLILILILSVFFLSILVGLIFFRNNMVYNYRKRLLGDLSIYIKKNISDVDEYNKSLASKALMEKSLTTVKFKKYINIDAYYKAMPGYNRMLFTFWVWDFKKFTTLDKIIEQVGNEKIQKMKTDC